MENRVHINSSLSIPSSEIRFRFSRSGGKGGQNVNKVETQVELLFDVRNSPSLSDEQRSRILERLSGIIDGEGILHISSQESRSQWKNREDAVRKFVERLQQALKPKKKRVKTKTTQAAKQKRLDSKKRRGETKKMRSTKFMAD